MNKMNNETPGAPGLMRRGAAHHLKFEERCGSASVFHGSGDALENFLFFEEIEVGGEALGEGLCAEQDADFNVSFVGGGGEVGGGNPGGFSVSDDTFRMQRCPRGGGMVQRSGKIINSREWCGLGPLLTLEPVEETGHQFPLGLGVSGRPLDVEKHLHGQRGFLFHVFGQ